MTLISILYTGLLSLILYNFGARHVFNNKN